MTTENHGETRSQIEHRFTNEIERLTYASELQGFQVALLMDAHHRLHPSNGQPGDECAICSPVFEEVSEQAIHAYEYARRAARSAGSGDLPPS